MKDTNEDKEESMSGSSMFWIAFFISMYLYGTYLIIHNNVFVGTNKPDYNLFTNFSGFEGIVMCYWLVCNFCVIVFIVCFLWFSIPDVLDVVNNFLDKTLK